MVLSDQLEARIKVIAEREGRTPEEVLRSLLDEYERTRTEDDSIEAFIGAFDDDITDLSQVRLADLYTADEC